MNPTSLPGFFQSVLESSPIRVAVINRDGSFVYVNRITAESQTTIQSRTIFDYIGEEDGNKVRKHIVEVFDKGITVEYINRGYSEKGQSWYRNIMAPLMQGDKIDYAVISFEIIDDAKEKEEQLRNKKAQLSAIINNTNDVILSIDRNYNIIEFNDALAAKVKQGFNIDLQAGQSVFNVIYTPNKQKLIDVYERVLSGERIILTDKFQGTDNKDIYFVTSYNPIVTNEEITGISIFGRDISDDKEDEATLRTALKEKETLLSEIHHRVKNNLAAISSIIQLHAFNTENQEVLDLLSSAMNRLKTTALVHEMLYENESLSLIDFKDYIIRLCKHLSETFQEISGKVKFSHQLESIILNIRQAIPSGLILNELITNAFKHGFTGKDAGTIFISLQHENQNVILTVSNDGYLIEDNFNPDATESIGMILIQTLSMQLDAELTISNKPITTFSIKFKIDAE